MDLIRELPFAADAEQAIIGSVLIDPNCIIDVLDIIDEDCFYVQSNKHIFSGMIFLFNNNIPIDIITLSDILNKRKVFDAIGGNAYLKEIMANVPVALNIKSYSNIIKDKKMLRDLINSAVEIDKICYENHDISNIVELAITKIFDVAQSRDTQSVSHIKSILYDNYNKLSEIMANGGGFNGLPTGYTDLDYRLQGLKKGNLVLIAARPGMGKSSFAANIAQNVAIRQKIPVALFTLEMSKEELANRIICSEAKINNMKLQSAELSKEEIIKYIDAIEPIATSPIYIDDTPSISATELRAKCKRLKLERNLGLVVIDYLQLMQGSNKESRQQEISEISRSLKLLAKELEIPVIALSQLNRASEQRTDHRPMISDLRESGAIEQDADIIMFLYRDEVYNEATEDRNIAECIVAKNRAGETGKAKLTWIGEFTTFYNMERTYGN